MGCMWGTVGRGDEAASDQSHAQAGGDGGSAGHGASSAGAGAVCRCDEGGGSACTAGEAAAAEGAAAEGGVPLTGAGRRRMCIWPLPSIRREGVDARERAEGGLVTVATVV